MTQEEMAKALAALANDAEENFPEIAIILFTLAAAIETGRAYPINILSNRAADIARDELAYLNGLDDHD